MKPSKGKKGKGKGKKPKSKSPKRPRSKSPKSSRSKSPKSPKRPSISVTQTPGGAILPTIEVVPGSVVVTEVEPARPTGQVLISGQGIAPQVISGTTVTQTKPLLVDGSSELIVVQPKPQKPSKGKKGKGKKPKSKSPKRPRSKSPRSKSPKSRKSRSPSSDGRRPGGIISGIGNLISGIEIPSGSITVTGTEAKPSGTITVTGTTQQPSGTITVQQPQVTQVTTG